MNNRVEKLLNKMNEANIPAVVITSGYNRRYISGFTGSSAYIYVSKEQKAILTDFRYMEQAKYECPNYKIINYLDKGLNETLQELLAEDGHKELGFENHKVTVKEHSFYTSGLVDIELIPMEDMIEKIRMIKDEQELAMIEHAASIGDKAYEYILKFVKIGMTEIDVALEIEFFMKRHGASHLSFDTIVASGKRSSLPHATPTTKVIEYGDFVTLDFGCVYNGYCSDMTRTFVMGKASEEQKKVYYTVLEAQTRALDMIKAGLLGKEVDDVAREHIYGEGYEGYFGHGLGHSLGLEVHENPRLSQQGFMALEENMMATIEPGIYIPDFGGVRIEDLVVVTADGCKNFVHSSKELFEL